MPCHAVDPRPMAILESVHVSSKSGRGIVTIDGGHLSLAKMCRDGLRRDGIARGQLATTFLTTVASLYSDLQTSKELRLKHNLTV
jgi:hypothetical protein